MLFFAEICMDLNFPFGTTTIWILRFTPFYFHMFCVNYKATSTHMSQYIVQSKHCRFALTRKLVIRIDRDRQYLIVFFMYGFKGWKMTKKLRGNEKNKAFCGAFDNSKTMLLPLAVETQKLACFGFTSTKKFRRCT